ncbi:MAG: glycosyltransferase family 39 protein [bacterium]|nr:glycosyltransferase family 39 protein [bacterium]
MTLSVCLLTLIFTYVIASDVCFLVVSRILSRTSEAISERLFWMSRGVGPATISVLIYVMFLFFPNQTRLVYVAAVMVVFGSAAVFGRAELPRLVAAYRKAGALLVQGLRRTISSPPLVATLLLVLAALVLGVVYPIVEHDGLSAAIEARIMVRDMSMANYLAVKEFDPQTGYHMANFRTPFLQTLYVWFGLVAGAEQMDILARTVSPVFGIHCLALLGVLVFRRYSSHAAIWAVFIAACTPIFFYMGYNNGIDTARLFLSLAALTCISELVECRGRSWRLALVTGGFCGFALFGHLLAAPALGGGALVYLVVRPILSMRKLAAGLLVIFSAVIIGAQFHFLTSPRLVERLGREVGLKRRTEQRKSTVERPPAVKVGRETVAAKKPPYKDSRKAVPDVRGQGTSQVSQFIFGRMQFLTGVEYFGGIAYLFLAAIVLTIRHSKSSLENVFLAAAAVTTVVVLSGVRTLSWSNPRYVASILLIAAYFVGPLLAVVEGFFKRCAPRVQRLIPWFLVLSLAFPAILVTSIRGAKVEITNPGSFYADLRSLKWVRTLRDDPGSALATFWRDYFGIRRTIQHLASDDVTKLCNSHDFFAGVFYIKKNLPADAKTFLFRDARFFYYSKHRGVVWYSPEHDKAALGRARTHEKLHEYLCGQGFTHVLLDTYSTTQACFHYRPFGKVLENCEMSEIVFEYGTARVFELKGCGAVDQ